MRKSLLVAALVLSTQISFADDASMTNMPTAAPTDATQEANPTTAAATTDAKTTSCETIASACLNGGYSQKGGPGKAFWDDCMQPILSGHTVASIAVNASDVQACKQMKISKMENEMQHFQANMPTHAE